MTKSTNVVELRTDPKEARRKINLNNKKRGKVMESRVSRIFVGDGRAKVAASGAGDNKGDVSVPLPNYSGNLYCECKSRESYDERKGAFVKVEYEWFTVAEHNRKAMGSRLGVVIIHFHNHSGDYVFFRQDDIPTLEAISGNQYTFNGPIIDLRHTKAMKPKKAASIYRGQMLEYFKQSTGTVQHLIFSAHNGNYVLCDLLDFKGLLGHSEHV